MIERVRGFMQVRLKRCVSIVQGRRGRAGQGMVEFAIALPIVLILIMGIIEFSRLMITHTAISSASREAARFGAAVGNDDLGILPPYEDCVGIRDAAKRLAKAFIPVEDAAIKIQYDKGPGTAFYSDCASLSDVIELGDRIVVSITTPYEPLIPLGFGNFEITSVTKRSITKEVVVD